MNKLRKHSEFQSVFNKNKKLVTKRFVFLYQNINLEQGKESEFDNDKIKVGVVASKKVGNAVKRNRCKRILRAAISSVLKKLESEISQFNLILVARRSLLTKSSVSIENELLDCFDKMLPRKSKNLASFSR